MTHAGQSQVAREEWRRYWILPVVAALGNSASVLHIYSLGPFMQPLNEAFGWGRAEVSAGITVANCGAIALYAVAGLLIDKWGPRRVGLIGVVIMTSAVALLGSATGSLFNWLALWMVVIIGTVSVQPTIWTGAVASRFDASRGLAVALTLAGSGAASTLLPLVATWLIGQFGWRMAFVGLGTIWAVLLLPLILLFFRGANEGSQAKRETSNVELSGLTFREGTRKPAFYKLLVSGALLTFCLIGVIVHFVPILRDKGLSPVQAASLAGIVGIASIVGRIVTGVLLDRYRGDRVAACAFLLPIVAVSLLLWAPGSLAIYVVVALVVGLSVGSELDALVYLSTRHFGLKCFGVLFGAVLTASTMGTGLGPVVAGAIFDKFGSYDPFLLAIIPITLVGAVAMGLLGPYPVFKTPRSAITEA